MEWRLLEWSRLADRAQLKYSLYIGTGHELNTASENANCLPLAGQAVHSGKYDEDAYWSVRVMPSNP